MKEWKVKHHWHCVANSTLYELMSILDSNKQKHSKLKDHKSWLNVTMLLGTRTKTQEFIYLASKSNKRDDFNKYMSNAIEDHNSYIRTLIV